jgi:hypothetical protein
MVDRILKIVFWSFYIFISACFFSWFIASAVKAIEEAVK